MKHRTNTLIGHVDAFGEIQIGEHVYRCPDYAANLMIYIRILEDEVMVGEVIGSHNHLPFALTPRRAA